MPLFEKSCTSVRYLFMNCDDGALNTLGRNATSAEQDEAASVAAVDDVADLAAVDVGPRRERSVPGRLRELPRDRGHEEDRRHAPRTNGMRHAWSPRSASGSVRTENEKPKPPASASIDGRVRARAFGRLLDRRRCRRRSRS